LTRFLEVNDRVGVKVKHTFTQEFQSFIEAETRPTGGETGHKNVEVGGHEDVFLLLSIVNFYEVIVDDGRLGDH